jgi:hypothetical protein
MRDTQAQCADDNQLAVIEAHVDERCRAPVVHRDRHTQLAANLLRGREMIRVGVGIDDVMYAQSMSGSERKVTVDLADLGVDQGPDASVGAPDQIRLTASRCDLLKKHAIR